MKKTLLTLCTAVFAVVSQVTAQQVVVLEPSRSQGFLLLNSAGYPTVTQWNVELLKNTYDATGAVTTTLSKSFTLSGGKNFTSMAEAYYNPSVPNEDYSLRVTGLNASNNPVVVHGPERLCTDCPPPNMNQLKKWTCVGKDMAWSVYLYKDMNAQSPNFGSHYLVLNQAVDHFSTDHGGYAVPYYEWMNTTAKNNICDSPIQREYHGLAENDCNLGQYEKIVTRTTTGSGWLDKGCQLLNGGVWGVQKYLGNWQNRAGQLWYLGTSNISSYSTTELIDYINNNDVFNLDEELYCTSCGNAPHWQNEGWWGTGFTKAPWYQKFPTTDPTPNGNGGIWGLVGQMSSFAGGTPIELFGDVKWYAGLQRATITRVDQPATNVVLNGNALFNKNGTFGYPSLSFAPGLYAIEFLNENNSGLSFYYEVETAQTFTLQDKDFLEAVVYPVPMNGSCSIDLEAKARVGFTYTLYGPSMQVLHSEPQTILQKGQTMTLSLSSSMAATTAWPSGVLTHKFVFRDGSVLTIPTINL